MVGGGFYFFLVCCICDTKQCPWGTGTYFQSIL